ncbi:MAG: protease modulator HflC [Hyphomicrobiaceae bacterium]|nr:protease modulator HflC [Hyphomicrobiaceae bacterium]
MRAVFSFILVILVAAAIATYSSFFIVQQTEQALVLRFGEPLRAPITTPGLNWKIPVVETVEFFDKRVLDLDSSPQELITSDQKRLVVDAFARWRISQALLFYQTVRDERIARQRLSNLLEGSLRRVLGSASFEDIVRDKREKLMGDIARQVNEEAKELGIAIIDVRIKRADLPEANSQAIYKRMQTDRQREAQEFRAQGEEAARKIRAEADRDVTVLKAKATRDGEKIRAEGDATRNRIFAEAFGRDPDFFAFYRSMQAYEQGLKSGDTRMLLTPESEFFRYFNDPSGKRAAPAQKGK